MYKPQPWMENGACVGQDPDGWFPMRHEERMIREAKIICHNCSVESDCLMFALQNGMTSGIWGGKTPDERDRILYGRRRPHRIWA